MKSPIVLPDETETSEEWYRLLVETARDVIFTLAPDGTFTSLNPAFEATTGRSRAEWLGKPFMRFCLRKICLRPPIFSTVFLTGNLPRCLNLTSSRSHKNRS